MLGHDRLAGVVLNKYRGGLVSEGYGIEDRYASNIMRTRTTTTDLQSAYFEGGGANPG